MLNKHCLSKVAINIDSLGIELGASKLLSTNPMLFYYTMHCRHTMKMNKLYLAMTNVNISSIYRTKKWEDKFKLGQI